MPPTSPAPSATTAVSPERRRSGTSATAARPGLLPANAPWWLAAITLVTVAGFQPTIQKGPAALDLAHAVHGTAALGWSILLVVQAWLAGQGRRDWHRRLAVLGVACAITMVASSMPMLRALAGAAAASERFRPLAHRLLVMDVLLLALFVLLFAVAMASVRRPRTHARAMAATALLALPAGLGRGYMRLLSIDPVMASYLALATGAMLVAALIAADRRSGVREPVLPSVLGALVAIWLLMVTLPQTPVATVMMRTLA